jgi:WD40 repeat protein
LEIAERANIADFDHAIRLNLSYFGGYCNSLRSILPHDDFVHAVAFSPDGTIVITQVKKVARLWDARTGSPIGEPLKHPGEIFGVAFSSDGKTAITGCDDGARLWDARTGSPIGEPLQHDGYISAVVPVHRCSPIVARYV